MTLPLRIQLRRVKGWRMPDNTVKVDRSTSLGNPFRVGIHGDRAKCVALHRTLMAGGVAVTTREHMEEQHSHRFAVIEARPSLRGTNLACWCSLPKEGGPDLCHAATLLEVFQRPVRRGTDRARPDQLEGAEDV